MPGQLLTFVPPAVNVDAFQRIGPRGVDCVFVGFVENYGKIQNIAMIIPLENLLTGQGSCRPIMTKDWRQSTAERQFPLARQREWGLMLKGAKLMVNCSKAEFETETDKLVDPSPPYVPAIAFEQPTGVSHRMGFKASGPWEPDVEDMVATASNPIAAMPVEPGIYSSRNG